MSKNETAGDAGVTAAGSETVTVVGQAIAEAVATRETPKGVKGAVETIRGKLDEGAHVLWTTGGPRNSHIAEIGAVLVNVDDRPTIYLVQAFDSGQFKLFAPVAGKTGADQCDAISAT